MRAAHEHLLLNHTVHHSFGRFDVSLGEEQYQKYITRSKRSGSQAIMPKRRRQPAAKGQGPDDDDTPLDDERPEQQSHDGSQSGTSSDSAVTDGSEDPASGEEDDATSMDEEASPLRTCLVLACTILCVPVHDDEHCNFPDPM